MDFQLEFARCNRTPSSRQEDANRLASALEAYQGPVTVLPGFTRQTPKPKRTRWVDPETKLKRKHYKIPASVAHDLERARREHEEAQQLAAMADQFCEEQA